MAAPVKPASRPDWTEGNATPGVRTEPTGGQKLTGWFASERPPRDWMNWLFWIIGQWLTYFENLTDQFTGIQAVYTAYVGPTSPLATHTTLAAAVAAVGVGGRILVIENLALAATVQVLSNDVEIQLKPGVTISAAGATTGIRLSATGCRIKGGRMAGFGVTAVLVDPAASYAMISEMRFSGNATDITDVNGIAATGLLVAE